MTVIAIPTIGPTTGMSSLLDDTEAVLTGDESWPIVGEGFAEDLALVPEETVWRIMREMVGLNKYWDCLPKAKLAQEISNVGFVVVGSLLVTSGDGQSQYGYYFNPPYEFHAWVSLRPPSLSPGPILDVALPGVIEKGLITSDDIGPYLINREPVILCGYPPSWCQYVPAKVLTVEDLEQY